MTHTVMTLLCFSLPSDEVSERLALRAKAHNILMVRSGKLLSTVETDSDIFLFYSPTEAVLGASELMNAINSLEHTNGRILVHTVELDLESSVLEVGVLNVVQEMLERTPWGSLCVSEASYLAMHRSEIGNKVQETSWQLKNSNRRVVMYRVKADELNVESSGNRSSEDLTALRRALKPAPYVRRVLSMLVVYFLTFVMLMCLMCSRTFPLFWKITTSRYVVEFENFDFDHAMIDSYWKAFNGMALEVGSQSTLKSSVTVKRGYYDAYIVYSRGHPLLSPFDLKIGDLEAKVLLHDTLSSVGDRPFVRKLVAENLLLDGVIPLALKQPDFLPLNPVLDYFLLLPAGVYYSGRDGERTRQTSRLEDLQRLFYIWDTDLRNFIIFHVILVPPSLWLLQALFLSVTTWTPGYLIFRLRVVTLRGEKPGPLRAIKRCLAQFMSALCLGVGWFWPLISEDERTWSDMFSETKVVIMR